MRQAGLLLQALAKDAFQIGDRIGGMGEGIGFCFVTLSRRERLSMKLVKCFLENLCVASELRHLVVRISKGDNHYHLNRDLIW